MWYIDAPFLSAQEEASQVLHPFMHSENIYWTTTLCQALNKYKEDKVFVIGIAETAKYTLSSDIDPMKSIRMRHSSSIKLTVSLWAGAIEKSNCLADTARWQVW